MNWDRIHRIDKQVYPERRKSASSNAKVSKRRTQKFEVPCETSGY